jgi:hypothetical protein
MTKNRTKKIKESSSRKNLIKAEMDYLKQNTKFDEKEINEWFDEFNKVRETVNIQERTQNINLNKLNQYQKCPQSEILFFSSQGFYRTFNNSIFDSEILIVPYGFFFLCSTLILFLSMTMVFFQECPSGVLTKRKVTMTS